VRGQQPMAQPGSSLASNELVNSANPPLCLGTSSPAATLRVESGKMAAMASASGTDPGQAR
jgi:hypothetical protein